MNCLESIVEECRDGDWHRLIERVWMYRRYGQMAEIEIEQLRDHPDQLIQWVLRILKGEFPKRRMFCCECGGDTLCQLIDGADGSSNDVSDGTLLRLCQTCGLTYPMIEVDSSFGDEHKMFRETLEAVTEVLNGIERQETLSDTTIAEIRGALSSYANWSARRERARSNSALVETFDLSVRAHNVLISAEIETIDELCERSAEELLALRNMRPPQIEEIREQLVFRGRQLRGE